MTKYFCDRCGKEIPNISIVKLIHNGGELKVMELCKDCIEDIKEEMKPLAKQIKK